MEPALALMALAGKRLAPRDPDPSIAKPPPIPWWDDLRYMWRGSAEVDIRAFQLTLAADRAAAPGDDAPRLVWSAANLRAALHEGTISASIIRLHADAYKTVGVDAPGGALLSMPLLRVC